MSEASPHLLKWLIDSRRQSQATDSHEAYALATHPDRIKPGLGGVVIKSSDNQLGERELQFEMRPVLLGQVEVRVCMVTQSPKATRTHSKSAFFHTSPEALRDLAQQLLETADAAEKLKLKPKPVR